MIIVGVVGGLFGARSAIRHRRSPAWGRAAQVLIGIEILVFVGWAVFDLFRAG